MTEDTRIPPTQQVQGGGYFKAFNILFLALLAGQIVFALVVFVLTRFVFEGGLRNDPAVSKVLTITVPALMFISFAASYSIFKKRIELVKQANDLTTQLNDYRALYITRFALAEAPVLFALIAELLTGSPVIWLFVVIGIVSMLSLKPTKDRLIKELELSSNDIDKLEGVDEVSDDDELKNDEV